MAEKNDKIWKKFIKKHFQMFVAFIVGAILAAIGAIYVFLWFIADAQSTNLVPEILGSWSMQHVITFILTLIFWELIFIGIPVIIAIAAIYFLWWKKLPDTERKEYKDKHLFGKRTKRSDGGSAIMFLINIFFIIKVYMDGNWDVPFATWEFDYLVYSYLAALVWVLIIFAIPLSLGAIWWISREMKK